MWRPFKPNNNHAPSTAAAVVVGVVVAAAVAAAVYITTAAAVAAYSHFLPLALWAIYLSLFRPFYCTLQYPLCKFIRIVINNTSSPVFTSHTPSNTKCSLAWPPNHKWNRRSLSKLILSLTKIQTNPSFLTKHSSFAVHAHAHPVTLTNIPSYCKA